MKIKRKGEKRGELAARATRSKRQADDKSLLKFGKWKKEKKNKFAKR